MTKGILIGCDSQVAAWAFETQRRTPVLVDRAFGVIENDALIGAILFTSYNTVNVELSWYGKNSMSAGIVRAIARILLYELRVARCTVTVPKRPSYLTKKLHKFGFRYEGVQRRFYGPTDSDRHKGCRFVLFREDLEKIAGEQLKKAA